MNALTTIINAAIALNLPSINMKEGESFRLAVRSEDSAWAVLASVRTEAE